MPRFRSLEQKLVRLALRRRQDIKINEFDEITDNDATEEQDPSTKEKESDEVYDDNENRD